MIRLSIVMLSTFLAGTVAHAQETTETAQTQAKEPAPTTTSTTPPDGPWEGVYQRSGKTIKTGEWMGIAGGSMMLVGGTTAVIGGVNFAAGGLGAVFGSEEGGQQASQGAGMVVGGLVVGVTGFASFQVGPALMAGGSVRQAKAIRQVNPEAPRPWLGYSSWVPWAMGITPSVGSFLLQPIAYVLAGLQKGKNRLYWDARTAAYFEQNQPKVTVNLAPITVDGNRGLALVGRF